MLKKTIEMGLLFDYYGNLLTERQQEAIRLYYYQDLSLGEISGVLGISRQGVYDHLQRGEELLRGYEEKLGLVEKYNLFKKEITELKKYIIANFNFNDEGRKQLDDKFEELLEKL